MRVLKKIWWIPLLIYMIIAPSFISERIISENCKKVEIIIKDSLTNGFVTSGKIFSLVHNENQAILGKSVSEIDIQKIEADLRSIRELNSVEVYKTIDGVLHVDADQRDPMVRILTSYGNSYYIDDSGEIIPHKSSYTPRVIVVSGNIEVPDNIISSGNINAMDEDSDLRSIINLVTALNSSELWSSQVEQVWITEKGNVELVPRVGNQIIKFGKSRDFEQRLRNLEAFYENTIDEVGWNKYREINLMYDGQIVCKKR